MQCFMIQNGKVRPSVEIAYICVTQGQNSHVFAQRFVGSFKRFPSGFPHKLTVICNGGKLSDYLIRIFDGTEATFFERSNEGWDIGAYIELAKQSSYDLQVCFGESVFFHREGWLIPIAEAWLRYGPGMYGCLASYMVRSHILTTAFACTPSYLVKYPTKVKTKEDRYAFEHGQSCFWRQLAWAKRPTYLVTWDGVYAHQDWRKPANSFWKGDQSNCLVWCNHTQKYELANTKTKDNWRKGADGAVAVKNGKLLHA